MGAARLTAEESLRRKRARYTDRYKSDPEFKARVINRSNERYKNNPEEKIKARERMRAYMADPKFRENKNTKRKIEYSKNSVYREQQLARARKRLENPSVRKRDNEKGAIRKMHRRKVDPLFRFSGNIRSLIRMSFMRKNHKKQSKTSEILGCSIDDFKNWVEALFEKEMSWENYGKWEIDHYFPLFFGKTELDVIRLNHFTNLRPVWKNENNLKSNKRPYCALPSDLIHLF